MNVIDYIKEVSRPIITFMMVVGWIIFIAEGINCPTAYEATTLGLLTWWNVDLTVAHIAERRKNG